MQPLFLVLVLAGAPADPVTEYIQAVAPQLSAREAARLGALIDEVAKKRDLDPILLAAIVARESSFRSGLKACWLVKTKDATRTSCDHGLAQVNQTWIEQWSLDAERLQKDDSYNLMVASRILANLQKRYRTQEPSRWWSRYNSGTPSKRQAYEARVLPLMAVR